MCQRGWATNKNRKTQITFATSCSGASLARYRAHQLLAGTAQNSALKTWAPCASARSLGKTRVVGSLVRTGCLTKTCVRAHTYTHTQTEVPSQNTYTAGGFKNYLLSSRAATSPSPAPSETIHKHGPCTFTAAPLSCIQPTQLEKRQAKRKKKMVGGAGSSWMEKS